MPTRPRAHAGNERRGRADELRELKQSGRPAYPLETLAC